MTKPEEIYHANAVVHDYYARNHDKNVAYIRRKTTRRYYWNLLHDAVTEGPTKWAGSKVLELGCGTGTYTDYCLEAGATAYTGLDLSEQMLALARKKFPDPRAKFVREPLEDFAKNNPAGYDIIFSFSFLHHLPNVATGLASIRSMLAPNGVYVALHEVNTKRALTLIEKLDGQLEIVVGLNGFYGVPFHRRLALLVLGSYYNPWGGRFVSRVLRRVRREFDLHNIRPLAPGTIIAGQNLVDFQLNEPFCLNEKEGVMGEVRSYCFLSFPELMALGRPLNHEMLIMRKNP